jgi:hypothetical protein
MLATSRPILPAISITSMNERYTTGATHVKSFASETV